MLLRVLRELVWVPFARRDDERHAKGGARLLRREQRLDDRRVIEKGVLDEDRPFSGEDSLDEDLADLIRARARLVLQYPRRANTNAARGGAQVGLERNEVRAAAEAP